MPFNENLRATRTDRGMTQRYISDRLGVTPNTIGNWERGVREPSFELLVSLADILYTSIDDLLDHQGMSHAAEALASRYDALDAHGKAVVETVCSMEYERIQHSAKVVCISPREDIVASRNRYMPKFISPPAAGYGSPLEGEEYEMILVDESVPANADYAIDIAGNSMEPYIHDGEMVFVMETEKLENGDIGIFSVNGEMYCKQYYMDEDRNLHLLSANPDRSDASIHIPADSGDTVRCCGKVLLGVSVPLTTR